MDLKNYSLVLGIDVRSKERAIEICEQTYHLFDGIKIEIDCNWTNDIRKMTGLPIIYDAKLARNGVFKESEFVGTTRKSIEYFAEKGADYVIIHQFTGPLVIEEAADTAHKLGLKVLALPNMTHETSALTFDHPLDHSHVEKVLKGGRYEDLIPIAKTCRTFSEFFIEEIDYFDLDGLMYPAFKVGMLRQLRKKFPDKLIGAMGLGNKQWPDVPLDRQMEYVYDALEGNSFAVLASEICSHEDYLERSIQARKLHDEIVGKLI